jgi:hypothetical protein
VSFQVQQLCLDKSLRCMRNNCEQKYLLHSTENRPNLRYDAGICLQGLKNIKENLSHVSFSPDWELNTGSFEYQVGMPTARHHFGSCDYTNNYFSANSSLLPCQRRDSFMSTNLYLSILLHYFTYNITITVTMQLYLICIFSFSFTTCFGLSLPSSGVSSYAKTATLYWIIIS